MLRKLLGMEGSRGRNDQVREDLILQAVIVIISK